MAEIGHLSVVLALGLAVFASLASALGARWRFGELVESGRRAMLGVAALTTVAVLVLGWLFMTHDFSVAYVWQSSSLSTPRLYLLAGIWGGQSGSLLFWCWLTSLFAAAGLRRRISAGAALMPSVAMICAAVLAFFLFLVAMVVDPFERLAVMPVDGNGLNPLLQHPGMAFHPPMLYLGFTGMVVPYAYAMAALVTRRTDAAWIHASRRSLLIAWTFLTVGLALGARWAYDVLGWGGYWSWDPVENAALMPWLAATALLHSITVQARRGIFKTWNIGLVIMTFALVIVGTFLTRAGLVSSVHSFAQSDVGPYFLVFTAAVMALSLFLLWRRLPDLAGEDHVDAVLCRETAYLANNLVFMGALFGVFWGTLFPLVSEIVTDQRVTVGAPYFNKVVVPVLGVAIVLMGLAPLVTWRRTDASRLLRNLVPPLAASLAITALLAAAGVREWIALVGFSACLFALVVTVLEIGSGIRARIKRGEGPARAAATLFARNRHRYGGYVVHIGIVLVAIGVVGSNVYKVETERSLSVGDVVAVGDYTLRYEGLGFDERGDKQVVYASLAVSRDGRQIGTLEPHRDIYRLREDQPQTIPSILHRPLEDLYVTLGTFDADTEHVTVRALVNPLVSWIWLGITAVVAGTVLAAWPDTVEERAIAVEVQRLLGRSRAETW